MFAWTWGISAALKLRLQAEAWRAIVAWHLNGSLMQWLQQRLRQRAMQMPRWVVLQAWNQGKALPSSAQQETPSDRECTSRSTATGGRAEAAQGMQAEWAFQAQLHQQEHRWVQNPCSQVTHLTYTGSSLMPLP